MFAKLISSAAVLSIALFGATGVSAQVQDGPRIILGTDSCVDVNSLNCMNSGVRKSPPNGVRGEADSKAAKKSIQQYRSNLNDSTEVDGILRATTFCLGPNGERIPNGGSELFYFFAKSTNCEANSETRVCSAGILSGTASFTSCEPFRNCSGPGYALNHGQSGTFSNAPVSTSCVTAQRTCFDGTLGGNASLTHVGTCRAFASCTHQGVTIPHGGSRNFWRVGVSTNCLSERTTISCNDGVKTGANQSYAQTSCVAPVGCTHQGVSIAHGSSRDFWRVNLSTNCAAERTTVSCNNGVVSGANLGYAQTSCAAPVGCTHQGVSMPHGSSRQFWRVNSSPNCPGEATTVSCNNGIVSGPNLGYSQTSCAAPIIQSPATIDNVLSCNVQNGSIQQVGADMTAIYTRTGNAVNIKFGTSANGTFGDYWHTGVYSRTLTLNITDLSRIVSANQTRKEWDDQFVLSVNDKPIGGFGVKSRVPGQVLGPLASFMAYKDGLALSPSQQYSKSDYVGSTKGGVLGYGYEGISMYFVGPIPRRGNGPQGFEMATGNVSTVPFNILPSLVNGSNQIRFDTYVSIGGEGYYELDFVLNCPASTQSAPPTVYSNLELSCVPVLDNLQSLSGTVFNNTTRTRQTASMGVGLHYVPNDGTPQYGQNACTKIMSSAGCSTINTASFPMTGTNCTYNAGSRCAANPKNSGAPAFDSTDVICEFPTVQ